tara:strand:+ start:4362 stop:4823 length:462 start_codon:yes stop_codon:yes gene_type:complete
MSRPTTDERSLNAALTACVEEIGGQKEAGELLGVSHVSIHRYCVNKFTETPNMHRAFKLDRHGGNHVLRKWAELCGFDLVELDPSEPEADVLSLATQMHKENSQTMAELLEAIADQTVTVNEAVRIRQKIGACMAVMRNIEGMCLAVEARADQ